MKDDILDSTESEANMRVKQVREALGLSQAEFSKKVRLGLGTIKNIEGDRIKPNPRYFDQIAEACGVSIIWLETGEGEMFRKMTRREKIANFVSEALADENDDFKSQHVLVLAALSADGWKKLKVAANELRKAEEKVKSDDD